VRPRRPTAARVKSTVSRQTDKSFLVLFFKKEQVFFLEKEAKTFIRFSTA
jgi:hypothetical protein